MTDPDLVIATTQPDLNKTQSPVGQAEKIIMK